MIARLSLSHPIMPGCVNQKITPGQLDYSFADWECNPQGLIYSYEVDLEWSESDLAFIGETEQYPNLYRCYLPEIMKTWLVNNLNHDWLYEVRPHTAYRLPIFTNRFVFGFQAAADALLFKLTWC